MAQPYFCIFTRGDRVEFHIDIDRDRAALGQALQEAVSVNSNVCEQMQQQWRSDAIRMGATEVGYRGPLAEFQDRLVREAERREITSVSRTQAWKLEKAGLFPSRIKLGPNMVAWRLSDLMRWMDNLPHAKEGDGE